MSDTLVQEKKLLNSSATESNTILVYNDDVNTFDYVIESLIKVCKHNSVQAEQCTWIIHHNGKCAVKNGNYENLKPLQDALVERGIDAKIK
ncbi:MAG: ATP-dependent Clp protease adaptor ClpS [Crocinitomicaceae bacterium]